VWVGSVNGNWKLVNEKIAIGEKEGYNDPMSPRPALDTLDLAWGMYVRSSLPSPSNQRLLTRSSVPLDTVGFFKKFYDIPNSVSVIKEYANLDNPGHVTITPPTYKIRINEVYRGWHDAEASIIAHEMVHVLMDVLGVEGKTRWEDEMFTDAFAVFLGTALISNFRTSVDFYNDQTLVGRMGYLNFEERYYAMARFVSHAQIGVPSRPVGEWRMADLEGMEHSLRILKSRQLQAKKSNPKKSSECTRCGTPLERSAEKMIDCLGCGAQWKMGLWGCECQIF
jgi:hypothetical protein